MQKRPTYEELEQRVKESEKETIRRKKAEEALRKNEKRLKVLLAELTAKNEELDSFFYRVSHDLKSPIVTIDGFVGALR
jgi:chemotaxis family two-component system sensor kinase Cph1